MKRLLVVLLLLSSSIAQAETNISDEAIKAVQIELARATEAGEIEGGMILVHVSLLVCHTMDVVVLAALRCYFWAHRHVFVVLYLWEL